MIYEINAPKREVSIQIKTLIIDEESPELIATELERILAKAMSEGDLGAGEAIEALGEDATDEIELCTEGYIETNDRGQIEISYRENEDDPQIANTSKMIFHPAEPSLFIMSKEGAISSVLSFEEGKTHVCAYDTPFMPFKVYVTTNKLDNRLLKCGTLKLDYILNINGTPPQHFIITVKLKSAPEDVLGELFAE